MDAREQEVQKAKEEQLRLKKEAYEHWLQHPTTIEYLRVLSNHENQLCDNQAQDAIVILTSIRTVRAMRKIVLSSELFLKLSSNNQ